jgi:divalent metal cation (Fe/Co/Zn/Cd) transporter
LTIKYLLFRSIYEEAREVKSDRISILGVLFGIPLAMLGSALMLSILGFPIGVVLFAAGISMMTTPSAAG